MVVVHDECLPISQIIATVERTGYGATIAFDGRVADMTSEGAWIGDRRVVETSASGLATAAGFVAIALDVGIVAQGLFGIAILIGGYRFARRGAFSLVYSRTLDMNVLMSIAVVGAIVIGQWEEAAVVAFLFSLGNLLESLTIDRARGAIDTLIKLTPAEARVRRGDQRVSLPSREVEVGDVIVVSAGERIPLDGQVIAGSSSVDQAPITGESMPVEKSIGDEVFAGSITGEGYLEVRVSRPYQENTINRIVRLVEEAQAKKAPIERLVDSFARRYTPAVVAIAVLVMLVQWLGFRANIRIRVLQSVGSAGHRLPLRVGDIDAGGDGGRHCSGRAGRPPDKGWRISRGGRLDSSSRLRQDRNPYARPAGGREYRACRWRDRRRIDPDRRGYRISIDPSICHRNTAASAPHRPIGGARHRSSRH